MKKITLLSLIPFLFINNLVSQTPAASDIKKPAFVCGTSTVSDINSNTYKTLKIGTQCWMQSNLKVSKYRNGDAIPTGLSDKDWAFAKSGAYAIYDNNNSNNAIYGKLYNMPAMRDSRGLCPIGWHVPSDNEWTILINYLGGEEVAGGKMKSTGTSYWNSPNRGATNKSGFSVLPGGYRDSRGRFEHIKENAVFWSSTEFTEGNVWTRNLYASFVAGYKDYYSNRTYSASVRCLRDY
jgi:uncharacterized protein (TIGR02145 family)